ncbi:hypothetical protein L228DRAFT_19918 [Xylona heveae TC161]|uniref:Glycosyltransferase family 23 protein n=1 Tax=Xylona heveae (strain CBS 132557 / TC161) TaxID=1328760 RepID=A0A165K133_XYLHT|nr:hypothetical protein L228DRAFT_19918 [Xylona heveae TC161]KZF26873.1 hypothetical protein L228DRAFT_19918 [Xylona heveae TC161]
MLLSSQRDPSTTAYRRPSATPAPVGLSQSSAGQTLGIPPFLETPPPSPGLPRMIPRPRKHFLPRWFRKLLRLLIWFLIGSTFVGLVRQLLSGKRGNTFLGFNSSPPQSPKEYELVEDNSLAKIPAPVLVVDKEGSPKWTISVPPFRTFPLRPEEYENICLESTHIAAHVAGLRTRSILGRPGHRPGYYDVDPDFVDVAEAREAGLLPWEGNADLMRNWDGNSGGESQLKGPPLSWDRKGGAQFCQKSLTFVLESSDAGLGTTLMALWMAYGLAQEENRAFFVEESNWAFGRYTDFFADPPSQACQLPPDEERVPCPHYARHLVVSAATMRWAFGDTFLEHFEISGHSGVDRQTRIFELARKGYDALFHLASDDAPYLPQRVGEIRRRSEEDGKLAVGLHIRRGDRHPREFQYEKSYLPLDRFTEVAQQIAKRFGKDESLTSKEGSTIYLASDDPDVYSAPEFVQTERAQDRILLASKSTLEAAGKGSSTKKNKFIDENIGWEGGFYRDLFWSLGQSSSHHSPHSPSGIDSHTPPPVPELALRLRGLVARTYLLDLAVLGQMDAVVCTASSVACRLLAVMMGWDAAITQGRWQNIDGDWHWKALDW